MAVQTAWWHGTAPGTCRRIPQPDDDESKKSPFAYSEYQNGQISPGEPTDLSDPTDVHHSLHRGLSARQLSMIAIGGALGTGLLIGTGSALAAAGPGSIVISYTIVGGFANYATRFVDPALGFALGYTYWFKYIITTPNQLTAAALVIQYWCPREKVNPGVFIAVFLVFIIAINILGVKFFGEFEFWLSSIKVLVVLGLIILSLVLALGGGPNHDRTGFRYWRDPRAFAQFHHVPGSFGKFLAVWSSMVTAVFAFLGTELVGVTVGEAQNPRKNVPRAIKLTFWRILIFYLLSVLLVGMIVPYNSPKLAFASKKGGDASASPFVVAIVLAGIDVLPGFLNGCILIFVFSAANSDLYIASRTLHGLALKKQAPAILATTNKHGVPLYALGLSSLICCLAFLSVSTSSKVVFGYFVNLVSIFGLLTWISILVSHVYFIRARRAQGVDESELRYKSPFGLWGTYVALFFCCLIALTKNFTVFIHDPKTYGNFDTKSFITGYLGIPLYLIMIFGYKIVKKTKGVIPATADLWTGKDLIDADEERWLAKEAQDRADGKGDGWLYRHTLGIFF